LGNRLAISHSNGLYDVVITWVAVLPDPLFSKIGEQKVLEGPLPLLVAVAPDNVDGDMGLGHLLYMHDTMLI